jgi:hypothetical protein
VFVPLLQLEAGITREEIQRQYHAIFHKTLSPETLKREILPQLETVGLIMQEPDPEDKRRQLIYPTVSTPIISAKMKKNEDADLKSNRGEDSGVKSSSDSPIHETQNQPVGDRLDDNASLGQSHCQTCGKIFTTKEQLPVLIEIFHPKEAV